MNDDLPLLQRPSRKFEDFCIITPADTRLCGKTKIDAGCRRDKNGKRCTALKRRERRVSGRD